MIKRFATEVVIIGTRDRKGDVVFIAKLLIGFGQNDEYIYVDRVPSCLCCADAAASRCPTPA